ncbi:GNAT family N-acetyltransferase [Actinoplanes sp. NPDC049596]|uniref:GNAT family N-acetyltransferase n=1 Tax=unclassified Actinoplanes TaxID=2626549 RepID=UPI0034323492
MPTHRPDASPVARTPRLWIVTNRVSDYVRWHRLMADDPEVSRDWSAREHELARRVPMGPIADPLDSPEPLMEDDPGQLFFAALDRSTRHLVGGVTVDAGELGGAVHRDYRAQGYGHEMLTAVCDLAHHRFGIARLTAGCEATNVPSQRWLTKAGFTLTDRRDPYTYGNGRVIHPLWWTKLDPSAE